VPDVLEYAQHDRADKGECDICGDNAQFPDEWTGENHGKPPWFTSLPALTRGIVIGSGRKKSAVLSFRAIWIAATLPTWLKNREINALKSP
jgi:hypothetical protein